MLNRASCEKTMLGILIEIIVSWLILWIFCRSSIFVLGIQPTRSRLVDFLVGFFIAALCCAVYFSSFTFLANHRWAVNKEYTSSKFVSGVFWTLKSVLYEELIFRGALLYILIKKAGAKTACIISAICFGVYHWFSMDAFGNPMQMVFIFVLTSVWGFMFAAAFVKTRSMYLPIALHFGWNLIQTVVFSQGPIGKQLLVGSGGEQLGVLLSIVVFLFQLLAVPFLIYLYIRKQIIYPKN